MTARTTPTPIEYDKKLRDLRASPIDACRRGIAVDFHLNKFGYNERRAFAHVSAVIFPSEYSRRHYARQLGLDGPLIPDSNPLDRIVAAGALLARHSLDPGGMARRSTASWAAWRSGSLSVGSARSASTTRVGSCFCRHNDSTSRSASGRKASASRRAW
jgi:hypothetical protein